MTEKLLEFAPYILPLILAITLHEAAHGYVAYRLGDSTAKDMGRVSFNPLKHIDVNGTILIPGTLIWLGSPALFGYAKPVPVDFSQLRGRNMGVLLVAIAGPLTNLLLAYASALLLHLDRILSPQAYPFLFQSLVISVMVNIIIATFNMLPILPLDGGRILNAMLPSAIRRRHAATERYGMLAVIALFLLPPILEQVLNLYIPISYHLLFVPASVLHSLILAMAGIG